MPEDLTSLENAPRSGNPLWQSLAPDLLERSAALVFVADSRGNILHLSDSLCHEMGRSKETLLTLDRVLEALEPDPALRAQFQSTLDALSWETGSQRQIELPVSTREGERRPIHWAFGRFSLQADSVLTAVGSDPRGAWKLRPWLRMHSVILSHLDQAVIVVSPDGRILHWGGSSEQLLGEPEHIRLESTFSTLFPGDSPEVEARALLESVLSQSSFESTRELRRSDGGLLRAELRGWPIPDLQGRVVAALLRVVRAPAPPAESGGNAADATLSSDLLLSLASTSLAALITTDGQGNILSWNRGAERLGARGASRAMGKRLFDDVLSIEGHSWENLSATLIARGSWSGRVQIQRQNGTIALADMEAVASLDRESPDPERSLKGVAFLFMDQTEQASLTNELLFAKQAALTAVLAEGVVYRIEEISACLNPDRRELLQNVSDLRKVFRLVQDNAPRKLLDPVLQSISGQRLERELDSVLYELGEGVHRMARVVEDARRFLDADVEAPKAVRLGELLASAWGLVSHRFPSNIGIQSQLQGVPEVRAVQGPLLRGLCLLLLSCLDSCNRRNVEKSSIRLSAEAKAGWAILDVVDDGEGFGVDVRSSLTDLPYLAARPGIGPLMLGLCKEEIRSAGGSMELGGAPGMGTVIRLSFPLASASAALLLASADGRPVGERIGPVLVLEENDLVRRSIERHLSLRYQVAAHSTLAEVVKAVSEGRFAAAVMGFPRPESYGLALVSRLGEANPLLFRNTVILLPPGIRRTTRDRLESCGVVLLPRSVDSSSLCSLLDRLMSDLWRR